MPSSLSNVINTDLPRLDMMTNLSQLSQYYHIISLTKGLDLVLKKKVGGGNTFT